MVFPEMPSAKNWLTTVEGLGGEGKRDESVDCSGERGAWGCLRLALWIALSL